MSSYPAAATTGGDVVGPPFVRALERQHNEEANMGMLKKLIASGIAAKVIQEASKPQNQAKIKQAIADFQAKRSGQAGRAGTR